MRTTVVESAHVLQLEERGTIVEDGAAAANERRQRLQRQPDVLVRVVAYRQVSALFVCT